MPADKWEKLLAALRFPPRHREIVELILQNQSDKQIAAAMGLKVPTIRTYKARIFDRLKVADRIELILYLFALSHGIHPDRRP